MHPDSAQNWDSEVTQRFAADSDTHKWNALYDGPEDKYEKQVFRARRDLSADYILNNTTSQAKILDLGCGAGPLLEVISPSRECFGFDGSNELLEFATSRMQRIGAKATLTQGDCRKTGYPDEQFDFVACLGVISYLDDYTPLLHEIRRILRPGGTAIITCRSARREPATNPRMLARDLARRLGGKSTRPQGIGRCIEPTEVDDALRQANLKTKVFHGIGFGPLTIGRHKLLPDKLDVALSRSVTQWAYKWRWIGLRRTCDVSFWVCDK